ncbi:hypothetical protein QYE76_047996 [Lolium multiflorum]|uniref:Uncharacterized protein n=1 Tax=Lolium multiflorum TaxID=4521 RepID=A0AAD8TSM0_LOLMU|nr:hypothetical protein QYE76_047996 [Lolium multiflorum]
MAVEGRVVGAVIIVARVAGILGRRCLVPAARTLARVAGAWQRRPVEVVVAALLELDQLDGPERGVCCSDQCGGADDALPCDSQGGRCSAGTGSLSDLAIASTTAASSARWASSLASWFAAAAAAASFFDDFLFRPRDGEEEGWSRMTRAPLLRPQVGSGNADAFLTKRGVAGDAGSFFT